MAVQLTECQRRHRLSLTVGTGKPFQRKLNKIQMNFTSNLTRIKSILKSVLKLSMNLSTVYLN